MMKNVITEAVKNYSNVMVEKDIKVVKGFVFDECRTSSIVIQTQRSIQFIINIEHESLLNLAEILFGMKEEELLVDLQKELVNTIGGYFADHFYTKGYKLGLPEVEGVCDTKNGMFFENELLKINIRLKNHKK